MISIKTRLKILSVIAAMFLSQTATSQTVEVDQKRSLEIRGPIGSEIIFAANSLLNFKGKKPVWLVLSSPGGSVIAGMQVISAMRMLQSRGTPIHCVTTLMAASMAFQIFAECDKRYALEYSLLLFHPIRVNWDGPLTPRDALNIAKSMRLYEKDLVQVLLDKTGMDRKTFFWHFYQETLFPAIALEELIPDFMEVVKDVKGVKNPLSMR